MHKAQFCVITCIDFRFEKKIFEYLEKDKYLGKCDIIAIPGATRDFISPKTKAEGTMAWKELATSINFHEPEEIIFIDHQDCGGYGMDSLIPNGLQVHEDMAKHKEFANKLKPVFKEKYPDKKLAIYYMSLSGALHSLLRD